MKKKTLSKVIDKHYIDCGEYTKEYTEVEKMILRYMGYDVIMSDMVEKSDKFKYEK